MRGNRVRGRKSDLTSYAGALPQAKLAELNRALKMALDFIPRQTCEETIRWQTEARGSARPSVSRQASCCPWAFLLSGYQNVQFTGCG